MINIDVTIISRTHAHPTCDRRTTIHLCPEEDALDLDEPYIFVDGKSIAKDASTARKVHSCNTDSIAQGYVVRTLEYTASDGARMIRSPAGKAMMGKQ